MSCADAAGWDGEMGVTRYNKGLELYLMKHYLVVSDMRGVTRPKEGSPLK